MTRIRLCFLFLTKVVFEGNQKEKEKGDWKSEVSVRRLSHKFPFIYS